MAIRQKISDRQPLLQSENSSKNLASKHCGLLFISLNMVVCNFNKKRKDIHCFALSFYRIAGKAFSSYLVVQKIPAASPNQYYNIKLIFSVSANKHDTMISFPQAFLPPLSVHFSARLNTQALCDRQRRIIPDIFAQQCR